MMYQQNEVIYERIDNIGYIMREHNGIPDLRKVITLNPVAADIWEYMQEPVTANDVTLAIYRKYEGDYATIVTEVNEFIKQLIDQELIVCIND